MIEMQKTIDKLHRLKWSHVVLIGVALGGGFLFWDRFQADLAGYIPYLILLLCPLMHVFLHRGHGHEGHGDNQAHKNEQDHN